MSRHGLKAITHSAGCGYGDSACSYLAALDAQDIEVCWQPLTGEPDQLVSREQSLADVHDSLRPTMDKLWQTSIAYDTLLLNLPPIHLFEHFLRSEAVAARYCSATWELLQLPPGWAAMLNRFDGVMVPSHFNARVFAACGVEVPVTVIPHVARRSGLAAIAAATAPAWLAALEGLYMFYTIGTWTTRKAMEATIGAYLDTFTTGDDVCLVVKTEEVNQTTKAPPRSTGQTTGQSTGQSTRQSTANRMTWYALAKILADYPNAARVHLVTERLSPAGIDCLHARGDCYLSLTHSEGWGLGAFDALQFGNPVIMPGFGGQLDYLGEDYPLLVRHELEPLQASPGDGYFPGMEEQLWARACRRHASELLRRVYTDRAQAAELGRNMQERIAQQFSAQRVGPQLARALGLA